MAFCIEVLVYFLTLIIFTNCLPLDNDLDKVRQSRQMVILPTPGGANFEPLSRQSGFGGLGSSIAGSVIGTSLAALLPLLLRPMAAAASTIPRIIQELNSQHNYDAYVMDMPGTKDSYLYMTLGPQYVEDAPKDDIPPGLESLAIPYLGTKIGTVNIKVPSSGLAAVDSDVKKVDYKVYEEREQDEKTK